VLVLRFSRQTPSISSDSQPRPFAADICLRRASTLILLITLALAFVLAWPNLLNVRRARTGVLAPSSPPQRVFVAMLSAYQHFFCLFAFLWVNRASEMVLASGEELRTPALSPPARPLRYPKRRAESPGLRRPPETAKGFDTENYARSCRSFVTPNDFAGRIRRSPASDDTLWPACPPRSWGSCAPSVLANIGRNRHDPRFCSRKREGRSLPAEWCRIPWAAPAWERTAAGRAAASPEFSETLHRIDESRAIPRAEAKKKTLAPHHVGVLLLRTVLVYPRPLGRAVLSKLVTRPSQRARRPRKTAQLDLDYRNRSPGQLTSWQLVTSFNQIA